VTRIIAGSARGRRLAVPSGGHTRPTSDRTREGLFSTLESLRGSLAGARILDLYAGSGAVGLEALSRGASQALLVESDARAAAVLRANAAALGLAGAQIAVTPVERLLTRHHDGTPYDIVFLDPPYTVVDTALGAALRQALDHGWVAPGAIVVVERATRTGEFAWPVGFSALRSRRYGEGTLWYGRAVRPRADGPVDRHADQQGD
jgi:16S rRNA (guanine966-N2)-methyltransferase